ncbi:hypothetical protein FF098_016150 [Parvularcula flava]|nr:hypothetical protein [Aquisalinus luteolus]NHK29445.1 hypothetical protein [Aquisalinus luteolus]
MKSLEIKAVRTLRSKIFANMAVLESFCGHMRRVLAASHDVEVDNISDRELAQMVQQWLSVGDNGAKINEGDASPEDIKASFAVLQESCKRLLGPDFTLEEAQALTSLQHYLVRQAGGGEAPATAASAVASSASFDAETPAPSQKRGFMTRFWDALNSA